MNLIVSSYNERIRFVVDFCDKTLILTAEFPINTVIVCVTFVEKLYIY